MSINDDPIVAKWDERFMQLARHVAMWSKDPSTKVGAVVVDAKRRVIAMGYNGFPRGVDDSPERYADRPTKYAHVVHAELNAILNALGPVEGCTLYVTLEPCTTCAKAIIQSGITRVVLPNRDGESKTEVEQRWGDDQRIAYQMMDEALLDVGDTAHGDPDMSDSE
jgi:dCMP deaminase